MRIAQVVSTYPPYRGGMGNVAASFFSGLSSRGYDCTVLTPRYRSNDRPDTRVVRLQPWIRYGNSAFVPQLYRQLKQFDLVHLHYPFYGGAEAVWLLKKRHPQVRLVLTYHMDVIGSGIVRVVSSVYRKLIEKPIVESADVVTCSSIDYLNCSFINSLNLKRRVELPFGTLFSGPFKARSLKPVVLFVGGLDKAHEFKGVDVLIHSMKHLKSDANLVVAGSGDLAESYKRQVHALKLQDRVVFTGTVAQSQLVSMYRSADVTALPSTTSGEAFGMVLIESMACGTPVVASDLPGVRTVVADGKTGRLAIPGDAIDLAEKIDSILSCPADYAAMSQQSVERVNSVYRMDTCLDSLESIYRSTG